MKVAGLRAITRKYGPPGVIAVGLFLVLHHLWTKRRAEGIAAASAALMIWVHCWLRPAMMDFNLLSAIRAHDLARVHSLLKAGANPNTVDWDDDRKSALLVLLESDESRDHSMHCRVGEIPHAPDCPQIVKELLDHGARIEARDEYLNTPLLESIQTRCVQSIRVLVDAGADVNAAGEGGITPLSHAAQQGEASIAESLLDRGTDVNAASDGGTPLIWAISGRHEATLELLLKRGANVNAASKNGTTPLLAAAATTDLRIVKLLLNLGAHVNVEDGSKATPLIEAVANGDKSILEFLLSRGADINAGGFANYQMPPLAAAVFMEHADIAALLLRKGVNVNARDLHGNTALHYAEERFRDAPDESGRREADVFIQLLKRSGATH